MILDMPTTSLVLCNVQFMCQVAPPYGGIAKVDSIGATLAHGRVEHFLAL